MTTLALTLTGFALAASPAWQSFRADGVQVRYPRAWYATSRPLTPVTSPQQVLAIASYPLPSNSRGADGCEPKAALTRMPPNGAFIYGWDYGDPRGTIGGRARQFPERPRHFRLTGLARYGCLGRSYMLRFREANRFFQIHIVLGTHVSAVTRAVVLRILDSFRARPL